jgi:site-specific DNA-methyltransferase (adenine-specific)
MKTPTETETPSGVRCSGWLGSPIYQEPLVKIYNGDCREIMPHLPRGLVVSDPPYNVGYHYEGYADNMATEDYQAMLREVCPLPCVIIHYAEDLCAMAWTLEELPQKIVAWVYPSNTARQWRGIAWWGCKPDFTKDGQPYKNPTDKRIAERIAAGKQCRLYDWWEVNQVKNVGEQKTEHPCQIPEEIMRRILTVTDCKLVVDPFCGSGTTLVAAKRLGIPAIGIERNKNYCELAARRVSQEMTLVPPNNQALPHGGAERTPNANQD